MELEELFFDEDDQKIFLVDDLQLKAEAMRHSMLPKMKALTNHAIFFLEDIYKVELLEDSTIAYSPHFRQSNRIQEVKKDYDVVGSAICGKRKEGYWPGIAKPDGAPVTIVPFGMQIDLDAFGISTSFHLFRPTYTKDSFQKFFSFVDEYHDDITALLVRGKINWWTDEFMEQFPPITPLRQMLKWSFDKNIHKIAFRSDPVIYPISSRELTAKAFEIVFLYPIYDSFIQISKGEPVRFKELLSKLNDFVWEVDIEELNDRFHELENQKKEVDGLLEIATESASQRIKVMAAMRWRVLQRDNWRCVSCGRSADDQVILHVDHILPRSKGGLNELSNYQTLCSICNIGKSNKDDTNIRATRSNNN